jgi:plasmid maintenance system antidote protein VapI
MRLKEYLDREGITITHFAERLDVVRNTVYALLNGTKTPSLDLAIKIQRITRNEVMPLDFIEHREELKQALEKE